MKEIDKYVVISGVTGVHKMVKSLKNGVIILDSTQGITRFVPTKASDISALGMITVYMENEDGSILLREIFVAMRDKATEVPVPETESQSAILRGYFKAVVPEHDEVQVRITDIKKIVKWYHFMVKHNMLDTVLTETPDEVPADETAEATTDKAE